MKYFGKYLDENGYDADVEYARKCGFIKDQMYVVEDAEVGRSHTNVSFRGIEGKHNSVMFEFYNEQLEQDEKGFYSEPLYQTYFTPW